jgi:OOP family OmpA-OmpF porin
MKHLFTFLAWAVPAAGLYLACAKQPPAAPAQETSAPPAAQEDTGRRLAEPLDMPLPEDLCFQFGLNSDVLEDTRQADALAAQLAQGDLLATLTGHACPLGPEAYNQALSLRRAMALAVHLERAGVPAWRLKVEAMGEAQPVARLPRDYWKNRRVNVALSIGVR